MSNLQTDVPLINVPLSTTDGRANPIWFQFFIQLWRRTGGAQGSSPNDLRVSDIDIDPDAISADLQAAVDVLDETNTLLQLEAANSDALRLAATINDVNLLSQSLAADPDVPKLAASVNEANALIRTLVTDDGLTSQQASLLSKVVDLSLILEEAQDVAKKLQRAIQDATIEQIIPLDVVQPASATPLMDGTAAVGSSLRYARQDHVHPTDTTREPAITAGTTAQYWRGDKTFQALVQAVVVGLRTTDTPQFAGLIPYTAQVANVGPGTTNIPTTSDTGGLCLITARQGGVGTSSRLILYNNKGGTLVITSLGSLPNASDPISSVAVSGANIQVTLGFANTNVQYGFVYIPT
jgi:hypothetical protein